VVNASPLILLAKIGRLGLLTTLAEELVIPASVALEVKNGPQSDLARQWLMEEGTQFIVSDLQCPRRWQRGI